MNTLLAALPLVIILVLMVGFRWGGSKAGAMGWLSALVISALWFGAGPRVLFWAQVQGVFRALYVLYIIWGALFFFRVTEADGTLASMSAVIRRLAPGRILQVLLLAWGFASFLQGVGGYGVPVAVVAPILVSMGFPPLDAVVMSSLGLSWAVSLGSLGASYEALVSATAIEGSLVALWIAIAVGLVCFMAGFSVLWIAAGNRLPLTELAPLLTMAMAMALGQYLAVRVGLENIAAMLGALAGLIVGGLWATLRQRQLPPEAREHISIGTTLMQMLPYILLITTILAVNFIPFLNTFLNQVILRVEVPALSLTDGTQIPASRTQGISIFGHPGAQLIYIALITLLLAHVRGKLPPGSGEVIRKGVVRSGVKSTLGILTMMVMATTMQLSGMVTTLATTSATLAGRFFPLIAPFIGALGAFMTGSNTNSNVLLGAFQVQVAETLVLYVPLVLALHNAGAAVGSVFSPAKVIVGCSTVGLSGGESDVLRRISRYSLLFMAIVAVLGYLTVRFVPGL